MNTAHQKLVVIGGGNGTQMVVKASIPYWKQVTAIVGVTDSGRSTGLAREIGNIPAPGDIRNSISELAVEKQSLLVQSLNYRFDKYPIPQLEGMALGNLLLAGMSRSSGSFTSAVAELQRLIPTIAEIIPVSDANTHLSAELEDGTHVRTELEVRGLNKSRISRLYLDPISSISDEVRTRILEADTVVLGPGSFMTTVCASLIFENMKEVLRETQGRVVFVCNTTTQPGQTDTFTVADHVSFLISIVGEHVLDYVICNDASILSPDTIDSYSAQGLHPLVVTEKDREFLADNGVTLCVAPVVERSHESRELWNKMDTIRHDPALLGRILDHI